MENDLSADYVLGNDIDCNSISNFAPVGDNNNEFTGSLDGLGHVVSNLYINRGSTDYIGLFGYTDGATISNIIFNDANIAGYRYTGTLVGAAENTTFDQLAFQNIIIEPSGVFTGGLGGQVSSSTLTNIHVTGNFVGSALNYTGGIIGELTNLSTLQNSYADISMDGKDGGMIGGLVGRNENSIIENCYTVGDLSFSDQYSLPNRVGGLVGQNSNYGEIHNSYAAVNINGETDEHIGSLVGWMFMIPSLFMIV
jgi:hypothetical protein